MTNDDNKRLTELEMISKRLMRRASRSKVAIITPFPISNTVFGENVSGTILCYMFPCDGTISKGCVGLGSKPKQPVEVTISVLGSSGGSSRTITMSLKDNSFDLGMSIKSCDRLTITLKHEESDVITEVWSSFLWTPATSDVEVKSYLIAEMENGLRELESNVRLGDSE